MLWIFYTIAATALQTFRNIEQKSLNKRLDAFTVSWSRFILPFPFAILAVFLSYNSVSDKFILLCLATGLMQVVGNVCLLGILRSKNFVIGITFYKTEILQTVILGLLIFHEKISLSGLAAILVTVVGTILMSNVKKFSKLSDASLEPIIYGVLCGLFFSFSVFFLKFSAQELYRLSYRESLVPIMVLLWVIFFQNIFFVTIKLAQQRLMADWKSLFNAENKLAFFKTTILSFLGSVCWFTAFSLGQVIYVKALSQIELVFAVFVSHFFLKERLKRIEAVGVAITSLGILWLIFIS